MWEVGSGFFCNEFVWVKDNWDKGSDRVFWECRLVYENGKVVWRKGDWKGINVFGKEGINYLVWFKLSRISCMGVMLMKDDRIIS